MAFGSWDDVIREYKEGYLNTKYATHARRMLRLIPQIKDLPDLADALPGTSHGTFFLRFPHSRKTLNIWYEGNEEYQIYLYHPDGGERGEGIESEKRLVRSGDIVEVLQDYLQKMQQ